MNGPLLENLSNVFFSVNWDQEDDNIWKKKHPLLMRGVMSYLKYEVNFLPLHSCPGEH